MSNWLGDLKDSRLMYLKAALFMCVGITSVGLFLVEVGSIRVAILLAMSVWAFCRLYYFMFYAIEKYVDPDFKFAGIFSFVRYLVSEPRRQ